MTHVPIPETDPATQGVRAMGVLMTAGGLLAAATALLPPAAEGSETLIFIYGAVATVIGLALLAARPSLGELGRSMLGVLGTALITFATYEGGISGGTVDNQILYLWICFYAFYFLSLPGAVIQLGVVGVAYAWLVHQQTGGDAAWTRWLVTMTSLAIAGMLISRMRSSLTGMVDQLSRRARHDDLTGLLNRSALEERFAIERAHAVRDGKPVSVLAVDIDEFKALNDTLGHPAGDQVLRQVAVALREWTRELDAVARVGGDEFAVILPATPAAGAVTVAEELCAAVSRNIGPADTRVAVSIGVTTAEAPPPAFGELWQVADAAMYAAKRSGGARVEFRPLGDRPPAASPQPAAA